MSSNRCAAPIAAPGVLVLAAACQGVAIDETDHDAVFFDARVRADLDSSQAGIGPHLEVGWSSARGETGPLEYAVDTLTVGGGADFLIGTQGWMGGVAGFTWQQNDFETSVGELHDHNALGPYVGVEGGWHATSWLEPYARLDSTLFLDEFATTTRLEAGVRLHFVEHAALFVGWRQVHVDIDDLESGLEITSVELDASGLVVGLVFAF